MDVMATVEAAENSDALSTDAGEDLLYDAVDSGDATEGAEELDDVLFAPSQSAAGVEAVQGPNVASSSKDAASKKRPGGRRNIRTLRQSSDLNEATLQALREEEQRMKRLNQGAFNFLHIGETSMCGELSLTEMFARSPESKRAKPDLASCTAPPDLSVSTSAASEKVVYVLSDDDDEDDSPPKKTAKHKSSGFKAGRFPSKFLLHMIRYFLI